MKKVAVALAVILSSLGQFAHAGGIQFPSDDEISKMASTTVTLFPFYVTMYPTEMSSKLSQQNKVINSAREDIAYFVATDGAVRTAKFNIAMTEVRGLFHDQQSQDMELALDILSGSK